MRRIDVYAGRAKTRALRWLAFVVGLVVLVTGAGSATAAGAPHRTDRLQAAENPYQRGPHPTRESVTTAGTLATASMAAPEFRRGTIYYPTDTSHGTFGAIAFIPGYNGSWAALEWTGPWLASHGFVVIGFEATNGTDGDTARGTQLLSAMDYLTTRSPVRDRVDPNRTAVIGHSMGGGGAMAAAARRPSLKAAIGLAPAVFSTNMTTIRVPSMLIAGQKDTTVTPSYTKDFYNQILVPTKKAYVELTGAVSQLTVNAATAGTATLRLRFANGTTTARPASLIVNGATVQTPSFEGTGAWNTWVTKTLTVTLNAGSNVVGLNPTTADGLPNIDYLEVVTG